MRHVISFKTTRFDLGAEPLNSINPIWGSSVLVWLRAALAPRVSMTEPDEEDWGWYSYATLEGRDYLLGSQALGRPEDPPPVEFVVQLWKQRSLTEKLFGRSRMAADDPLSALVLGELRAQPGFEGVQLVIE